MDYLPYVLLGIALLMVGSQLRIFWSAKSAQGKPAPEIDDLSDEKQRTLPALLFYFHSEYCGPCRRVTPLIEDVAEQTGAVVLVDVGQQPEVAMRFGVRVTPTLMRISNGVIEKVIVGEVGKEKLKRLLE